jgi:hypothetical protein
MQTSLPRHSYDHRTQKGRAASDPTASICPIESAEEVAAFATASQADLPYCGLGGLLLLRHAETLLGVLDPLKCLLAYVTDLSECC